MQISAKMRKSTSFSSVCCLTFILTLWSYHVESSVDVNQWCVDDVTNYDSYQSAVAYVNAPTIGQSELQTLIDDALARAGCQWLETTSSTNIVCSNVSKMEIP